ncbi:MAG: hypothetical protein JXB88_11220 [Spirochaetales bacterium]|nr:hypothetical protein [Spirochaetales bacterium]
MIKFIFTFLYFIISLLFKSRKDLLAVILTLEKQNTILKRTLEINNHSICFTNKDRVFFHSLLSCLKKIHKFLILVKPKTVLSWYKKIIRNHWDSSSRSKKTGKTPNTC